VVEAAVCLLTTSTWRALTSSTMVKFSASEIRDFLYIDQ
jgi:hypothetical protein